MILLTNITIHVWDGNHDTQMCCKSCGSRMQPIVTVVIYHCEVCPKLSSQVKPCQATVQPCAAAAKTCQHADTQNVSSVLFTSPYRKQQSFTLIDHPSSDRHLRIPDLNRVHNIRKFAISQAAQLQTAPCWRNCRPPLGLEAPEVTELSLLLLLPSRQALVGVHWGWNKAPWCAWNTVSLLDQWAKTWHGFINEQKKSSCNLKSSLRHVFVHPGQIKFHDLQYDQLCKGLDCDSLSSITITSPASNWYLVSTGKLVIQEVCFDSAMLQVAARWRPLRGGARRRGYECFWPGKTRWPGDVGQPCLPRETKA